MRKRRCQRFPKVLRWEIIAPAVAALTVTSSQEAHSPSVQTDAKRTETKSCSARWGPVVEHGRIDLLIDLCLNINVVTVRVTFFGDPVCCYMSGISILGN